MDCIVKLSRALRLLPRDTTHKRSLCRCLVYLAGMSVTFVYCVGTAKDTAIVAIECE